MRNTELNRTDFWTELDNGSKQEKQLLIIKDEKLYADEIDFFPSSISDSCTLVLL
ncbi:MAG: hypothetical protein JXR56_09375 [Candidatus Cloacimonetes bacterium]|nr:hypothetical protein [Candidatus Cloacimonadota bacterium]